ncbi:MAG TPA: low molecular weight phosphotyrosine protein phosphatase [Mycobacteriales bacterium]|nr:low molecular weight phosphotyrosine protein phosphatase [Mycobacteriales bacterium]
MGPSVLIVCTGNICRSPMAQAVLLAGLPAGLPSASGEPIRVASAGTHALVGNPIDPDALAALAVWGVPAPDFAATQLTAALVQGADLLLGATREHRAAAVTLAPARARHAYTLREFGRLAAAVDPAELPGGNPAARLTELLTAVRARRGTLAIGPPADEDIPDPYRRGGPAFDAALRLVHQALRPLTDVLTPPAPLNRVG